MLRRSWSVHSSASGDVDDLWDFGTVRHVNRPATIGRAQVSGPPLTWEIDGPYRSGSDGSDGSTESSTTFKVGGSSSLSSSASFKSSITAKGELPPLPPNTPRGYDQQATLRHVPSGGLNTSKAAHKREPSDEFEDYDDQDLDTYAMQGSAKQQAVRTQLEDDLPDTTMLDSVVLPAIASVGFLLFI